MKLFLILTRSELMIWVEKRFFYHFGFHLVGAREGTNNAIHNDLLIHLRLKPHHVIANRVL